MLTVLILFGFCKKNLLLYSCVQNNKKNYENVDEKMRFLSLLLCLSSFVFVCHFLCLSSFVCWSSFVLVFVFVSLWCLFLFFCSVCFSSFLFGYLLLHANFHFLLFRLQSQMSQKLRLHLGHVILLPTKPKMDNIYIYANRL